MMMMKLKQNNDKLAGTLLGTDLLTSVNTKVSCSNCSTLFHLQEHTQVVDFKEFFTLLYMNVPMFLNIYKVSPIFLHFTKLSRGVSLFGSGCRQPNNLTGTFGTNDIERYKSLIYNEKTKSNLLEQCGTLWNKVLDKTVLLCYCSIFTNLEVKMTSKIESYGAISNQTLTIRGVTRTLKVWAELAELPFPTVRMRWTRGHRDPKLLLFNGLNPDLTHQIVFGTLDKVE
jgi:hypothetical protein